MSSESENTRRMNGFISASRNCFLLTTVGVAVFGFGGLTSSINSKGFIVVRFLSMLIYIIALLYLINMCVGFNNHLKYLEKNKVKIPKYDLLYYQRSLYIAIIYGIFILIPLIYLASRKFIL